MELLALEMLSDPAQLGDIRLRLSEWARRQHWSEAQVGEVVLALDEAITNVIRHGYQGRNDQPIWITAQIVQDPEHGEGLEIEVRDNGRQVDPACICGRPLDDVRPGGLGVHIIRAMNSTVVYQCVPGGGMRLVMRKYRTHKVQEAHEAGGG